MFYICAQINMYVCQNRYIIFVLEVVGLLMLTKFDSHSIGNWSKKIIN
jgi:hypothetical protein